jgi:hypothetical protein
MCLLKRVTNQPLIPPIRDLGRPPFGHVCELGIMYPHRWNSAISRTLRGIATWDPQSQFLVQYQAKNSE